jgi:hypothetical protein
MEVIKVIKSNGQILLVNVLAGTNVTSMLQLCQGKHHMKFIPIFFVASISLTGCITQGSDASGPNLQQVLSNAFTAAGQYYGGRAQGYQQWQDNHGNATVIVPGEQTIFVNY